jgi:hypothetical protein
MKNLHCLSGLLSNTSGREVQKVTVENSVLVLQFSCWRSEHGYSTIPSWSRKVCTSVVIQILNTVMEYTLFAIQHTTTVLMLTHKKSLCTVFADAFADYLLN